MDSCNETLNSQKINRCIPSQQIVHLRRCQFLLRKAIGTQAEQPASKKRAKRYTLFRLDVSSDLISIVTIVLTVRNMRKISNDEGTHIENSLGNNSNTRPGDVRGEYARGVDCQNCHAIGANICQIESESTGLVLETTRNRRISSFPHTLGIEIGELTRPGQQLGQPQPRNSTRQKRSVPHRELSMREGLTALGLLMTHC